MDYIGTKFDKKNYDGELYTQAARWCNESQKARIEDKGDFYEVVALPEPSLDEMKAAKLNELRATFDERVSGTIDAHDYQMQFDISDSLKMQGAIQLLETTGATEGYLTLANDETVYHVPLEVMKAVLVDMLSAYAACHARKQEIRAAISSAQTAEDLDAIEVKFE